MIKRLHINKLLMLCGLLLPIGSTATAAENTNDEEEPRWFEIEVIVYKPNNEQNFNIESWDKDLGFTPKNPLVDFLQPYYLSDEKPCFVTVNLANEEE